VSKGPPNPNTAPDRFTRHPISSTHQRFFRTYADWLAQTVNAYLLDADALMAISRPRGQLQPPIGPQAHPADHFARALGAWMRAMQAEPADYLGRVYEEQAITNAYQGQFFTPEPVVELMTAMTMPDDMADSAIVHDPACGSGRMLIAGIRRNRFATFVGVDTDLTCVHITTLNCLVHNANSWIIHGNSLSLEAWRGYHVRRTAVGGELHRLSVEEAGHILRLPFTQPEASTALSSPESTSVPPAPIQMIQEPSQAVREAIEEAGRTFTVDKRGQGDFGF